MFLSGVKVHVAKGYDMLGASMDGRSSNVQVSVSIGGTSVLETAIESGTVNPEWDAVAEVPLAIPLTVPQTLRFTAYHVPKWGGENDCIGCYEELLTAESTGSSDTLRKLTLAPRKGHEEEDRALDRRNKGFGYLLCSWVFTVTDTPPEKKQEKAEITVEKEEQGGDQKEQGGQPEQVGVDGYPVPYVQGNPYAQQQQQQVDGYPPPPPTGVDGYPVSPHAQQDYSTPTPQNPYGYPAPQQQQVDGYPPPPASVNGYPPPPTGVDGYPVSPHAQQDFSTPTPQNPYAQGGHPVQQLDGYPPPPAAVDGYPPPPPTGVDGYPVSPHAQQDYSTPTPQSPYGYPAPPQQQVDGYPPPASVDGYPVSPHVQQDYSTPTPQNPYGYPTPPQQQVDGHPTPLPNPYAGADDIGLPVDGHPAPAPPNPYGHPSQGHTPAQGQGSQLPPLASIDAYPVSPQGSLQGYPVAAPPNPYAEGSAATDPPHSADSAQCAADRINADPAAVQEEVEAEEERCYVTRIVSISAATATAQSRLALPMLMVQGESAPLPATDVNESRYTWETPIPSSSLPASSYPHHIEFSVCDGELEFGPLQAEVHIPKSSAPYNVTVHGDGGLLMQVVVQVFPLKVHLRAVSDELLEALNDDDLMGVGEVCGMAMVPVAAVLVVLARVEVVAREPARALVEVVVEEQCTDCDELSVPAEVVDQLNVSAEGNKWLVAPYEYYFPGQRPVHYNTPKKTVVRYMVRPPNTLDYNSPLYSNILGENQVKRMISRATASSNVQDACQVTDLTMVDVFELEEFKEEIEGDVDEEDEEDDELMEPLSPLDIQQTQSTTSLHGVGVTSAQLQQHTSSPADIQDVYSQVATHTQQSCSEAGNSELQSQTQSHSQSQIGFSREHSMASRKSYMTSASSRNRQYNRDAILKCPSPECGMDNFVEVRTKKKNLVRHVKYCGSCGCHLHTEIPDGIMDELHRAQRRILEYESEMIKMEQKIDILSKLIGKEGRSFEARFTAMHKATSVKQHADVLSKRAHGMSKLHNEREKKSKAKLQRRRMDVQLQQHSAQMARIRQQLYEDKDELFAAAKRGSSDIFQKLKRVDPELLNLRHCIDQYGRSPLNIAAQHGHYTILSVCLKAVPAETQEDTLRFEESLLSMCTASSQGSPTLLHSCVLSGKLAMVEFVVQRVQSTHRYRGLLYAKTKGYTALDVAYVHKFGNIAAYLKKLVEHEENKERIMRMHGHGNAYEGSILGDSLHTASPAASVDSKYPAF